MDKTHSKIVKKSILFGIGAGLFLLSIYFTILTFANSFSHALDQFVLLWYWMVLLIAGFGLQVGLYVYIRLMLKQRAKTRVATSTMAAAGGVSTTSMIACCAHHLADVIPLLGISAAAVFLNQFQNLFIIIGVISNLIGITMILGIIQKHHIYNKNTGLLSKIMRIDMKKLLYANSGIGVIIFFITLFSSL